MKKVLTSIACLTCLLSMFVGCSKSEDAKTTSSDVTTISLWTYPIGGWGEQAKVDALLDNFHAANPDIKVTVDYLTYADGDDKVNTAIEGGAAPDLIMEGPERLVANWGAKGKMVDISDLYDETDKAEINPAALKACFADSGAAYEYPLVMTAHCMAINKTVFEKTGAIKIHRSENKNLDYR